MERVKCIPTDNLTAYDYLLRGFGYYNRYTKEANTQARQMAEKAFDLDPQYALAYVLLGVTHFADTLFLWSPNPR
jgi:hypothetical protein